MLERLADLKVTRPPTHDCATSDSADTARRTEPKMTSPTNAQTSRYDEELRRNSIKQRLLAQWPKPAIRARYLKSLFRGEIELRLLPWLCDRALASIDVGAHHGIYSFGASLFSKRVIAIEPQANLARALRQALSSSVSVIEGALSDRPGTATINIPIDDWDSTARLDLVASTAAGDCQQWREQQVTLMRLDDIVSEPIGFVKIDVEGHELEVLEGAKDAITTNKPALLIEVEERHRTGSCDAVAALLLSYGYRGYFVFRGAVRPIHEFSARTHQVQSLIGTGDRSNYSDYINNFIFVQRSDMLPSSVPSPWSALADSLLRLP
jgi:FkbM family methyltransferase